MRIEVCLSHNGHHTTNGVCIGPLLALSSPFKTSKYSTIHYRSENFGWPTIAVDIHIFRLANRTKFAPGKNVVEVEERMLKVVPAEFKVDVHHWFILHGRYTCLARKPRCGSCIIEDLCEFKEKVYPEE